jgi:hypothetical protein
MVLEPRFSYRGFFYYRHIIRKDVLNKVWVFYPFEIPHIKGISVSFTSNQQVGLCNESHIFTVLGLLEFLTSRFVSTTKCDVFRQDHFTSLQNIKCTSEWFGGRGVYEFFVSLAFLWLRGLVSVTEQGFVETTTGGGGGRQNRPTPLRVEYFRYLSPIVNEGLWGVGTEGDLFYYPPSHYTVTTWWNDFTFLTHIPLSITSPHIEKPLKLQLRWGGGRGNLVGLIMSGLRFKHHCVVRRGRKIRKGL